MHPKKVITCLSAIGMSEAIELQRALNQFVEVSRRGFDPSAAQSLQLAIQSAGTAVQDTSILDNSQKRGGGR